MKVLLVSDSHDNIEQAKQAVEFAKNNSLELIIHCGDFVAPFTAKIFVESGIPLIGVFGNCDGELVGLKEITKNAVSHLRIERELDGKKVIIQHRPFHEQEFLNKKETLFFFGHTHRSMIKRIDSNLVVNPGELCGSVNGVSSLAVVDIQKKDAEIVIL